MTQFDVSKKSNKKFSNNSNMLSICLDFLWLYTVEPRSANGNKFKSLIFGNDGFGHVRPINQSHLSWKMPEKPFFKIVGYD